MLLKSDDDGDDDDMLPRYWPGWGSPHEVTFIPGHVPNYDQCTGELLAIETK